MTGEPARGWGRVAATLRALVFHPGSLTREELAGRPADHLPLVWVLPVLATAFFALTSLQQRRAAAPSSDVAATCAGSKGDASGLSALLGVAGTPGTTAGLSPEAVGALHVASEVLCDPGPLTRALAFAFPIALLLLMPLSAGLMQAAFRRQMPGFRANWVYGLEVHSALFLLLSALALLSFAGSFLLGFVASVGGLVYTSWNLVRGVQTAYGVSERAAVWRTTAVGVVYALFLIVAVFAVMWVLLAPANR
ncbi:MAG: hypothetical protein WBQ26_08430 [Gemmatimonadaceae bacterium]